MTQDNEVDPLEAVQAARSEVSAAFERAEEAQEAASELSYAIDEFRTDTARRLNPWRVVATTTVGAFIAGLLSLTMFVTAAATCEPGEGGYCAALAPESEGQEAVIEALVTTQLRGTEFLLGGGTTDAFLAGEVATTADLVTVVSPDGDGSWTILSADATDEFVTSTGLDFSLLPAPQEEVFGQSPDNEIVLNTASVVLETGLPQSVTRLISESGILFTTRAVPHGPNTVALFTMQVNN